MLRSKIFECAGKTDSPIWRQFEDRINDFLEKHTVEGLTRHANITTNLAFAEPSYSHVAYIIAYEEAV
jgi:hypothetical protein